MLVPLSRRQQRIEAGLVLLAALVILAFLVLAIVKGVENRKEIPRADEDRRTPAAGRPTPLVSSVSEPALSAGGVWTRPSPGGAATAGHFAEYLGGDDRRGRLAGPGREPAAATPFESHGGCRDSNAEGRGQKGQQESGGANTAASRSPSVWTVTAYCVCKKCCGPRAAGVTASGTRADHRLAAAPANVPFGTVLSIPGYGVVKCEDRGGAIRGRRLDVLMPTHAAARAWGVRQLQCGMEPATARLWPCQGVKNAE